MEEIFNKLSIKDNVEPEVSNKLSIKDNVEPEVSNKTTYQCFGESIEIYESNQHYTNLIIGEELFTQDIWINELTQIIRPYN